LPAVAAGTLLLLAGSLVTAGGVRAAPARLADGGTASSRAWETRASTAGAFSFRGLPSGNLQPYSGGALPHQPMNKTLRHDPASTAPRVSAAAVAPGAGGAGGFPGLDDFQQANAGTGRYAGSQFDVTPPDQGLCVGPGKVLEVVNAALRVYSTTGRPLTLAVPLNEFVGAPPEYQVRHGATSYGPFLFDPRCYFDPGTDRWFVSIAGIAVDPASGAFGNTASQYLAVSRTPDPTRSWRIYSFPTTDDGTSGTPSDPGCPCFGDQPLFGADANGIYVTTNEYSIRGRASNGAQLYALSKAGLEKGSDLTVVQLQPGTDPAVTRALGGVASSIQPGESPDVRYATAANGTEYFQSALDFGAGTAPSTGTDRIAVWSLTGTASLARHPALGLHVVVLRSERYAQPSMAAQAPGSLLIDTRLPTLDVNDDRMNQVVYARGHLWGSVSTAVRSGAQASLCGLAWFATTPHTSRTGALSATLAGQGYLAVNAQNTLFPSIAVTPTGKAVVAFTLTGPDRHPSAAWAPLSLSRGVGSVHVVARGGAALDDFSALPLYGGDGSARWGDYTAAVSDPAGRVWMGTPYVSGADRTFFTDWATFISHVTP
jgi:hypothetical protein